MFRRIEKYDREIDGERRMLGELNAERDGKGSREEQPRQQGTPAGQKSVTGDREKRAGNAETQERDRDDKIGEVMPMHPAEDLHQRNLLSSDGGGEQRERGEERAVAKHGGTRAPDAENR